ncbi:hypothetical protein AMJ57_00745 [Parcubacteria bacterium SG8_24]|nr:MAG: hypothetical protein AMJ57_00745 [Parcubacteria bacterium SG8_24]
MSGHSKWANIRHRKGAADKRRAALFTKLAKAITVAAREGGGDPEFNFRLRTAIDSAVSGNMPKDNIDKAVKRGTGEIGGDNIEEVLYEGFGPGGIAVLVEALTDNRNRTSANLKHLFGRYGGNLAGSGAVQWMFERRAVIRLKEGQPLTEGQEMALIDAGTEDIAEEEGRQIALAPATDLSRIREAAEAVGLEVGSAGLEWVCKEPVSVGGAERKSLEGLLESLDDDEDVNEIYTSAEFI